LVDAKEQTVVALAVKSVLAAFVSQWQSYALQSQAWFIRVLHGQTQMVDLFVQTGIPLVILKGAAAAVYYREPGSRGSRKKWGSI